MQSSEIIKFWFEEIDTSLWFKKDQAFDQLLHDRFSQVHKQAIACELFEWRSTAQGRLAEIIVLDQFSRNLYRDSANAFAADSLALALAQEAVAAGQDSELEIRQRIFLYMPYMHSESAAIHCVALELFNSTGEENNIEFEIRHKDIIDKYGRYPHRNEVLGRVSTSEELEFLQQPGSSF